MRTPEEKRAANAAWMKADREAHPEKYRARAQARREANREVLAAKQKEYRDANPDRARAWREANKEKVAEQRKFYRAHNKERDRGKQRSWAKANRGRLTQIQNAREARKRGLFVESVTDGQVWARTGGVCHLCLRPTDFDGGWQRDHVWPLRWGGVEAHDNLAPAHAACNQSKKDHLHRDWSGMPWVERVAFEACVKFHLGDAVAA